jgi:hypothetical protein
MTDTSVKLELLKLTVELTKFAIEQNGFRFKNPQPQSFEEAFTVCHKLINESYYQVTTDQTDTSQENGA